MLTPEERRQVIEELADYLSLSGNVREFVRVALGPSQREVLVDLPTSYTLIRDQAEFVVDHCMQSRWTLRPSLMELVLTFLVDSGKPDLVALRNRVQSGTDPNPNAYQTLWVLADQPFVDRRDLRTKLAQFVEMSDRPILRVLGVSGSGKSYTAELLGYVMARARSDMHLAPAQLSQGNGPSYEAAELAETLAVAFTPDESIPERRNSSYPGALSRWIVRNTLRKPGTWIYVLDGFGQPDVLAETRELVQLLAQYVCAPEFSKRLRLLLLDYDKPLTGNWRARTLDDTLPNLPSIQPQDLVDCLAEFNQRVLAAGTPQKAIKPADLPALAAALIQRSSAKPQDQLRTIYEELLAIAQA